MTKATEVTFAVRLLDGSTIEESAVSSQRAAVSEALKSMIAPFGRLVLRGGSQPELDLPDDLLPLADGLVASMDALRAGRAAGIGAYSQPFSWRFDPESDGVRTAFLDRNVETAARVDRLADLLPELSACASRLVALLSHGQLQRPNAATILESLSTKLA